MSVGKELLLERFARPSGTRLNSNQNGARCPYTFRTREARRFKEGMRSECDRWNLRYPASPDFDIAAMLEHHAYQTHKRQDDDFVAANGLCTTI